MEDELVAHLFDLFTHVDVARRVHAPEGILREASVVRDDDTNTSLPLEGRPLLGITVVNGSLGAKSATSLRSISRLGSPL